jgi:hypothetical protein
MKRDENKQQEQKNQVEQKHQPIVRVRSGLRAGATMHLKGCADDI